MTVQMWKHRGPKTDVEARTENRRTTTKKPTTTNDLCHKTVPSYGRGIPHITGANVSKMTGLLELSAVLKHDWFFTVISFVATSSGWGHGTAWFPILSPDAAFGRRASWACSAWKNEFSSRIMSTRDPPSWDGGGQLVCWRSSSLMLTYGKLWRDFVVRQRCNSRPSTKPSIRYVCQHTRVS